MHNAIPPVSGFVYLHLKRRGGFLSTFLIFLPKKLSGLLIELDRREDDKRVHAIFKLKLPADTA